MTRVNDGPGARYGFGFAGTSNGNLYLLGGFAPSKNMTGSWVQLKGGFSQLESSTRVRDLANDDLWLFNSSSVAWTLLTESVYFSLPGHCGDIFAKMYLCENYAGLARLALVHHDSETDTQGSKLYMMGGSWYLPDTSQNSSAWASYDIADRSWTLLLADKPSGLKWMYVGDQRPTGTEVSLPISWTSSQYLNWEMKLAQTLRDGTLEFTQEEWDVFEITLPDGGDSFIQAGEQRYFMPDRYTGPKFRTAGAMQKNPAAVSDADGNIFLLAQVGSDGGASKWDQLKYIKRLEKYSW